MTSSMKEEDVRKRKAFDRYLELVAQDVKRFFKRAEFVSIACPACGGRDHAQEFDKQGFAFVSCGACSTLFVNPRPSFDALRQFYSDSPSTTYFVNDFFKPVAEARRQMIFRPRAQYASKILGKKSNMVIGDIGAGFGLFLEELKKDQPDNRYVAIEPSSEMSGICSKKGLEVEPKCLEDIEGSDNRFDLLTSFELIEHLFDPAAFLTRARGLLKPGGKIFLTTLNGNGFDILLLWERSKSVSPPHHLNFFNTASVRLLLERAGFIVDEVSTPGVLDWDIVEGMIKNEGVDVGRLWSYFSKEGSEKSKKALQEWITNNNLSSHMRIVATKKNG